jgi:hypothetical protein
MYNWRIYSHVDEESVMRGTADSWTHALEHASYFTFMMLPTRFSVSFVKRPYGADLFKVTPGTRKHPQPLHTRILSIIVRAVVSQDSQV